MARGLVLLGLTLGLTMLAASCSSTSTPIEDVGATRIILPNGERLMAETMRTEIDVMRGMMFRDAFPEGRGMLFVHPSEGKYAYWTYQTRVALDIVWMDREGRIVEIVPDARPCETVASQCPNYGGTAVSRYVLELNTGMAAKYGLRVGQRLAF